MYSKVGDCMDNTKVFNKTVVEDKEVETILKEVVIALETKGYSAIDQIVGYLMSGDPGYISSYQNARIKITQIDRTKLLEVIVRKYLSSCDI